jgi:PAS domain S-box-containing protein
MNAYQEHVNEPTGFMPRMWLLVLAGLLLFLVAGGSWFYRAQEKQLQEEIETNLTAIAQLKVDQIVAWREDQLKDTATLAASPLFRRAVTHFLTNSHSEPDSELDGLLTLLKEQNDYASIMLLSLDGEVIVRSNGAEGELELPEQYLPVLETAVQENRAVFIDLHQHTDSAMDAIHISVIAPIYDDPIQSSEPLGALLVVTDASELLYPLVNSWPVPSQSAETLLIRQEGDEVLFLNELRHRADTALSLRLPLSQSDLPAVMAIEGQSGFVRGYDYRDVEVVAVLLPVPDSAWYMISKVDAAEAFANWQFRSGMIVATLAGLVAIIVGGWQYFWQRDRKTYYQAMYQMEAAARISARRHDITLNAIGDGVIVTDAQGQVELLNPVAETLTGWSTSEALGKPLTEVFNILNETTRTAVANPVTRVLQEGKIQGLANHTLLITRNGKELPIADSAAPIFDETGDIRGVVLVFREQTAERLAQHLTQLRLDLIQFAADHTLAELLTKALDETGDLVNSPIGFYHFVDANQETLSLQQWSTQTLQEYCHADKLQGQHYAIADAGVWADCVGQKAPVIHNDYASLGHKRGLPPGHAELIRELVVPVMRDEKVVAILGVGNKPVPYTQEDVELVSFMADLSWHVVENKRDQDILQQNQAMLATAEEVAGMGSWKWDLTTEKVSWSKGMFYLFGVSPNNFVGDVNQVISDRIHPDDIAAVQASNSQVLTEHKPSPLSYRIVLPDGTERTVWAQGKLVLDKNGEPTALTGYVQDITRRQQREKERESFLSQIRQQAERLQKVMDAAPEGIILLDSQYKLLQANVVARQLLAALTPNADVATGTLSHLGDRPLETLLTSPPKGLWHEVVADERTFEISARQLEHVPDQQGWVLVLRETTKQREFEEQLHRQERLASVGKLAAGIAHDFNNLLAVIVLYAQLLQAKLTLQPKEKEQFNVIVQQANRAARLIQQILDFSRRSAMTKQPLELRVLLKEEVALLKRTLPENIEIELVADNDEYLIHADVTRIQQVIMNLAVNARDAMPDGGHLSLKLDCLQLTDVKYAPLPEMLPGSWIHLSFSDSGTGIPPKIMNRIFDPFFTTKEPGDGTGLGLAQVHGIIGQHDGFIDVSSELGEGTTFDIYFPRLDMDIRFSVQQQIDNLRYGRGQRVLIVEDEATLREALLEVIQEWGYEVLQAGDGEQAMALLTENKADVDLIISDLVMPEMGGVAFIRALRQRNWQVPVLIMSGHPLEQDMDLLKSAGVSHVLPKPLHPALLNQTIAEILAE